jgi:hypothetical protein
MRRALGATGVALVLLLVAAGLVLAAPARTEIVHFEVFDASGTVVGVHVTKTASGHCFSGSIGLPRPDAWRCFIGNEILDPCLESPLGARVPLVCIVGTRAIRLRLTKPLPAADANRKERGFFPWRLVLANGDVCERFTGTAAGEVQGQGLTYGCSSGGTTTDPARGQARWTVRYLAKGVDPSTVTRLARLRLTPVAKALG